MPWAAALVSTFAAHHCACQANAERCRQNLSGPGSRVAGRWVQEVVCSARHTFSLSHARCYSCAIATYRVHIPWIHHKLTSARVLCMEYIPGVTINDSAGLRRLGISPAALSRLIAGGSVEPSVQTALMLMMGRAAAYACVTCSWTR